MSPAPAIPLDALAQQLTALGLDHAATALPELIETAARERLDPSAFLGRVLTRHLERKDERRIATMLTLSGLPTGKTNETYDWGFQPKSDRRQLDALATCSSVPLSCANTRMCSSWARPASARVISPAASASRPSRTASR